MEQEITAQAADIQAENGDYYRSRIYEAMRGSCERHCHYTPKMVQQTH